MHRSSRDNMVNFLEHCIMLAAGDPGTSDGEAIREALHRVADAFCPDLRSGAKTSYNVESDEIMVETPRALYYVSVRAVVR